MQQGEYRSLPKDYNFLMDNMRLHNESIYFQNLQFSQGKGGGFKSLDLIFFNNVKYEFLNIGFEIKTTGKDKIGQREVTIVPARANDTWKGSDVVDFNKYNPKDNLTNFFFMKYFLNISDADLLAHFINNANSVQIPKPIKKRESVVTVSTEELERERKRNESNLKLFINDINKVNKININSDEYEKSGKSLDDLCKEINKQMPDSDCGFSAYKTYIADNDEKRERVNLDIFYRSISSQSLDRLTDDFVLPRGDIEFDEKKLNLTFPKDLFFNTEQENKSELSFFINKIEHHLTYDFDKETYVLIVKIFPYSDSLSSDFKFISLYDDVLKGKNVTSEIFVNKNDFKNIEFLIYPDRLKINVVFKNREYNYDKIYALKKEIIFNKANSKK
ncbi:hypothetical protein [Chryseobacterium sp. FH1]|uniref:hypothetical protein n=1 Tax=Chryseobacterium sp. FH1 TaxID=1233951 RepID=UPI00103D05AD|nr:hypothetical protein [Chryseobacterium sp. FH1]